MVHSVKLVNILKAIFCPWVMANDRAMAIVTYGQSHSSNALLGNGQKRNLELVTPGDVDHKHNWQIRPWDEARFGKDFEMDEPITKTTSFYCTRRLQLACSCGAEAIRRDRELL